MTKESKHEKEEREERELEQEHKKELERQRKVAEHNRETLGVDVNHSSPPKSESEKPQIKQLPADISQAIQSADKLIPTSPKLLDYPEVAAVMLKAADYSTRQLMARSPGMTVGEAILAVVSQLLVGYPDTVSQVTGNQPVTLPDA